MERFRVERGNSLIIRWKSRNYCSINRHGWPTVVRGRTERSIWSDRANHGRKYSCEVSRKLEIRSEAAEQKRNAACGRWSAADLAGASRRPGPMEFDLAVTIENFREQHPSVRSSIADSPICRYSSCIVHAFLRLSPFLRIACFFSIASPDDTSLRFALYTPRPSLRASMDPVSLIPEPARLVTSCSSLFYPRFSPASFVFAPFLPAARLNDATSTQS